MKKIPILLLFFIAVKAASQLPLRLPSVIGNHAVLQQSADVKLWGWGPGSFHLSIVCSWNTADTILVNIGADCIWQTSVKTPNAGGPYTIEFICGKQSILITDILIGEVWLCSGQSNMEYNFHWGISDTSDANRSCDYPQIRFFQIAQSYDKYPQSDCRGEWKICNGASAADFSSVGYYFGRNLHEKLKVPVGLIGSYWQGTNIQTWMPEEAFERDSTLKKFTKNIEAYGWAPKGASLLYNGMIEPIVSYKLRGVLWYQGEANVSSEAGSYAKLFSAMIESWRNKFKNEIPFYYVQIAPWNGYQGINAALLREQQQAVLAVPATGMVNIGDLVNDVKNIHPINKRGTADRLSNLVLKEMYGFQNLHPYSPTMKNYSFYKNEARVEFLSVGKLWSKEKEIKNFQLAGADHIFYPAEAVIDHNGMMRLKAKDVQQPVSIRYCFINDQIPNLFDTNGLPLLPFRTDSFNP